MIQLVQASESTMRSERVRVRVRVRAQCVVEQVKKVDNILEKNSSILEIRNIEVGP